MAFGSSGIVMPFDIASEVRNDITYFSQRYYVDQFPLINRLQREPVGTPTFEIWHTKYRPQKFSATSALNNTDTFSTITIPQQVATTGIQTGDDSQLMDGDVLDLGNGEYVEVIATYATELASLPAMPAGVTIPSAPGTIVVKRAAGGTAITALAAPSGGSVNTMLLVGNSRTGGEVFQSGIRTTPLKVRQYCQNFMYPVQVSGTVESTTVIGVPDVMARAKMDQLTNMMRDMERTAWYSHGEAPAPGPGGTRATRPKMIGVLDQIVTNKKSATGGNNYLPANFINDVLSPLWAVGSQPDVMFCSPDVLAGFDQWGTHAERLTSSDNSYGVEVTTYHSSLAPDVDIIPCTTLRPGTIVAGMSEYWFWRNKRNEFWKERGSRGDAVEGEWIAEGAVEVRDEEKHAVVTGITTFGIPS